MLWHVDKADPVVRPALFNIRRADAVVIWILWQVAGVFVCSLGPDNLVTPLSSGASPPTHTALNHLKVPEPPLPFRQPTAILRQPLMEDTWMYP